MSKLLTFLLLFFAIAMLFTGCTTQRPLSLQIPSRDTLVMKPVIVNNETKVVQPPRLELIHDTIIIREITKLASDPSADTIMIRQFMDSYNGHAASELAELKATIVQLLLKASRNREDSTQRVKLQRALVATNKEKVSAQREIATTKVIMYDVPKYIYMLIALVLILFLLWNKFLRKQFLRDHKMLSSEKTKS